MVHAGQSLRRPYFKGNNNASVSGFRTFLSEKSQTIWFNASDMFELIFAKMAMPEHETQEDQTPQDDTPPGTSGNPS
jgi:hypothetical protein